MKRKTLAIILFSIIGGIALFIAMKAWVELSNIATYDTGVPVIYAIAEFYAENERFPESESEFIDWKEKNNHTWSINLLKKVEVVWGVSESDFLEKNVNVIRSVFKDSEVGSTLNRRLIRLILERKKWKEEEKVSVSIS